MSRQIEEDRRRIDEVLRRIEDARKASPERFLPIVGPVKGQVLYEAAVKVKPRRALELGTLVGYSALILAKADGDCAILTVEENPELAEEAKRNFEDAGVSDRIEVLVGDARKAVKDLSGPFDLVFLDIWKEDYVEVLDDCVALLRSGGVLVADNVLQERPALHEFRRRVLSHPELETEIVEVRDGMSLSTKL